MKLNAFRRQLSSTNKWFSLPSLLLFAFVTCCTILEDSDIITDADFAELKLSGFDIVQVHQQQTRQGSCNLLYDSAINVTDATTGAVIKRKLGFSITVPPSNTVFKFRSGATSNLQFTQTYLGDGKPYTSVLFQGDSAVEIYRFRYDGAGKLNRIITIINPVDNLPLKDHANDTIIYLNNEINKITRRSQFAAKRGTIEGFMFGSNGSLKTLVGSTYSYPGGSLKVTGNGGGDCPDNAQGDACTPYQLEKFVTGSGGSNSFATVIIESEALLDKQIELKIRKDQFSNTREQDTYYFHPMILLRGQLQNGGLLLPVYMIDWFAPGAPVTGGGGPSNFGKESVSYVFLYEK